MDQTPNIEEIVSRFFEAFGKLSPDEKLYFLAELDKVLSGKSEKEKKIYLALIKAAREGKACEEAISELKRNA